jgi:hypothetical protein
MMPGPSRSFRGKDSDPMQMSRYAGVYDAMQMCTGPIVEVIRDMKASSADLFAAYPEKSA